MNAVQGDPTLDLRRPTGITCLRTPQIDSLTWVPHGVLNSVVGGSSCKGGTPSFPLPKRLSSSGGCLSVLLLW